MSKGDKIKGMRCMGHVTSKGEMRNTQKTTEKETEPKQGNR